MKDIRAALAEYAAIVEGFAKEYTDDTTVETVRAEHSELDFMEDDEIEKLLEHAKNQRNKADYEVIEYEGKEYFITEEAEIEHSNKVRIGNTIFCLGGTIYSARCIDVLGNRYRAYWVANDEAELPEDSCRWDKPDHVELEI